MRRSGGRVAFMRGIFRRFEFVVGQYTCAPSSLVHSPRRSVTSSRESIMHTIVFLERTMYRGKYNCARAYVIPLVMALLWGPKPAGVWHRTLPLPNKVILPSGTMHIIVD